MTFPPLSGLRRRLAAGARIWSLPILFALGSGGCSGDVVYPPSERYLCKPHTVLVGTDQVKTFELSKAQAAELASLLEPFFGTPREPKVNLPEAQADIGTLQLTPESMAEGSKTFLAQCAHCHGREGNGLGKSAEYLNPKPRDFRQGKFKYITTVRKDDQGKIDTGIAAYPARADLHKTIYNGIPGAGMLKFPLADDKIEQLVSYAIHLSLRGQVEYRLTRLWLDELAADEKPTEDDVKKELKEILHNWASDSQSVYVPRVPWEEVARQGEQEHWATGRAIFLNKEKGGCTECHGASGTADPKEVPTILAMKDDWGSPIKPRNYHNETFRGGESPIDVFYRIKLGIKPSRMQAADVNKLSDADIWQLVGYVRSLAEKKTSQ